MSTPTKKQLTPQEAEWVKTGITPFNERAQKRRFQLSQRIHSYYSRHSGKGSLSKNELYELEGLYVDFVNSPGSNPDYEKEVNRMMRDIFGPDWKPFEGGRSGEVRLFDAKGDPAPFKRLTVKGAPKPFYEKALFNRVINWVADQGPAFSKVAFMVATACETAYAGWQAGKPENITAFNGLVGDLSLNIGGSSHVWLITLIVWGMGLMYESAFAFAWARTGSSKLAGDQVGINEQIFRDCLHIMSLGLVAAIVSTLFSLQIVLNVWLGIQALFAVHIIKLQRTLKVSHPTYIAKQEQIDMEAKWAAAWIQEGSKDQKLYLEKTEHARTLERKKLSISHAEDLKVVESKAYKALKKQEAINRHLLPDPSTLGNSASIQPGKRSWIPWLN